MKAWSTWQVRAVSAFIHRGTTSKGWWGGFLWTPGPRALGTASTNPQRQSAIGRERHENTTTTIGLPHKSQGNSDVINPAIIREAFRNSQLPSEEAHVGTWERASEKVSRVFGWFGSNRGRGNVAVKTDYEEIPNS